MAALEITLTETVKDVPPGAWAAVWDDEVIAFGADIQQVLAEARLKGINDPLMVKVPECLFLGATASQ
jgi:Family of unknown function (DUF5678)